MFKTRSNTAGSFFITVGVAVAVTAAASCGPTRRDVTRLPPDAVVDVDYRFDDEDARQVAIGMVNDATFRGWIDRWQEEHDGRRPIMIVGPIKNATLDPINTKLFTRSIERELLNTGRVRVAAMRDQRGDLRDERFEGQDWSTPETQKALRAELGADLMLMGDINEVRERSLDRRTEVIFYQVNLDLTNIESNEKIWIGQVEIKKTSVRR